MPLEPEKSAHPYQNQEHSVHVGHDSADPPGNHFLQKSAHLIGPLVKAPKVSTDELIGLCYQRALAIGTTLLDNNDKLNELMNISEDDPDKLDVALQVVRQP